MLHSKAACTNSLHYPADSHWWFCASDSGELSLCWAPPRREYISLCHYSPSKGNQSTRLPQRKVKLNVIENLRGKLLDSQLTFMFVQLKKKTHWRKVISKKRGRWYGDGCSPHVWDWVWHSLSLYGRLNVILCLFLPLSLCVCVCSSVGWPDLCVRLNRFTLLPKATAPKIQFHNTVALLPA